MKTKTVIITGGSSGIGLALAKRFAASGANVVFTGRNEEKLHQADAEVKKINPKTISIKADVTNQDECELVVKKTIGEFGSIDVLINNAGISMRGLFVDTNAEVIKKVMDTNFWGAFYITKFALPHLIESKGSLVAISSIAGKKGLPGRTGYSASKFAVEGLMETIRTENIKNGLHVLVACPGFTKSGIRTTSLGPDGVPQSESPLDESKLMSAESVADAIYKAVNKRKRDLTLTLYGKLTILLNKLVPGISDRLVYKYMSKEPGSPFK